MKLDIRNTTSGTDGTVYAKTTSTWANYGLVGNTLELTSPNASNPIALDVKLNSSYAYGIGINVTSVVSGGYFNVNDIQLALSHIGYAKGIAAQGNAIQSGIEIGVSNSNRGLLIGMSNSTVASGEGSILMRRLRNNGTTTVSLLDGDELGSLDFAGKIKTSWSNSVSHSDDFASGAYIKSFIEGTPSFNNGPGSIIPANLKFYTNSGTLNSNPIERMVINSTGNVGIGTSTPSEKLEVSGNLKVNHIKGGTSAPTITAGTGAGTTPTISITNGTDLSGIVNCTTGTLPTAGAVVVTITFNTAYGVAPNICLTPANAEAALLNGVTQVYATSTTTTLVITAGSTGLAGATTYKWFYVAIQ